MNTLFSLGCKFDTAYRRLLYRTALGPKGLFTSTPSLQTGIVSLSQYEEEVTDQGGSGSCEGHAGAMGAAMAFNSAGSPLGWHPSEDAIYKDARCMERAPNPDGSLPDLQDTGCMTADVQTIFQTCGLKPRGPMASDGRNSDVDPATMNNEPRIDELIAEKKTRVLVDPGSFAVDLTNTQEALAVIQAALSLKYPVRLDIVCDDIFQLYFQQSQTTPLHDCNPNAPGAGGHAILLTEMSVKTDGSIIIAGLNSWGKCGAPPLVLAGPNQQYGHYQADANWFKLAAAQATVWKCTRIS